MKVPLDVPPAGTVNLACPLRLSNWLVRRPADGATQRGSGLGQQALALLETWGLWGAMTVLLLEGIGLPFPVEAAFLGVGAVLRTGHVSLGHAVIACWCGAVAGNLIGYGAAVWGGRPVLERLMRLFRLKPERMRRLELWVQRNGLTALLITRLTHWGFAPALWLAGIMRLPWLHVLSVMLIGDLLWVLAWVLVGASLLSSNPLYVGLGLLALAAAALLLRRVFQPPAEAAAAAGAEGTAAAEAGSRAPVAPKGGAIASSGAKNRGGDGRRG